MTPEKVLETVEAVMLRPFEWGPCDCSSAACDVFLRLWGIDPMASVRAQYADKRGAAILISQMGGFRAMAHGLAARSGLAEGHVTGGIALSGDLRSLLICITPGHWAGKTRGGFAILRAADRGWHA